jgi:hypothetical protein
VGLFDAISGIGRSVSNFVTDFAGGAFVAVDERLRGGRATTGAAAGTGRRIGSAVGNLFGDIGESFLSNAARPGPAGTASRPAPGRRGRPSAGAQNVPGQPLPGLGRNMPVRQGGSIVEELMAGRGIVPTETERMQQAGFGGELLGELLGAAAGRGLEFLEGALREDTGLIPGFGPAAANLFFGEEEMAGRAVALPGGASITQPVAPQAGRIFNIVQNLSTGGVSVRARQTLLFLNPMTGNPVWYRNMGRPVLWTGDLAASKRVRKAASRARRFR